MIIKILDFIECFNYGIDNNLNIINLSTKRILKPSNDKKGYKLIKLRKNNKTFTYKLHRLIAQAFIPNPENKPEINHINGVKNDNRIENLEWCTRLENMKHAQANGFCVQSPESIHKRSQALIGKKRPPHIGEIVRKIASKQVICIDTGELFSSATQCAKDIGMSKGAVTLCCLGINKTAGGKVYRYHSDYGEVKDE